LWHPPLEIDPPFTDGAIQQSKSDKSPLRFVVSCVDAFDPLHLRKRRATFRQKFALPAHLDRDGPSAAETGNTHKWNEKQRYAAGRVAIDPILLWARRKIAHRNTRAYLIAEASARCDLGANPIGLPADNELIDENIFLVVRLRPDPMWPWLASVSTPGSLKCRWLLQHTEPK
jgi:hypothetical protein